MDDLCAPQWVDFVSSPQLPSDSYFEVEHEVHGPLPQPKLSKPTERLPDKIQVCAYQEAKVTNECAKVLVSSKTAFFVPCGDNTKNITQATTLDSVLDEVKDLQSCAKARRSNLSISLQGKRNSQTKSEQKPDYANNINKTICGNFPSKCLSSEYEVEPVEIPDNIITEVEQEELETHLMPDQSPKSTNNEISKRLSYKTIRRQSNVVRIKRSSLTNCGPRVLTSQYRRRSLNKYRRRSKQFISLAEAVTKFHTATPDRFRTLSQKDVKSAANSKFKRMSPKLTFPVSPALRCKNRTRTATVITKEQQELKELEEMKKHQIKAKPIPAGLLKAPAPLKKIGKKPPTVTEKCHLTQCKKRQTAPVACTSTKQQGIKKADPPKNISSAPSLASFHARPVPKFTKPGPPKQQLIKKPLVTCPFSFEQRDKILATRKEQHVKQILEERGKLPKFHANPLPSFIYGGPKEISKSKDNMVKGSKSLGIINVPDQENKEPNIIKKKHEIGVVKPLINEENGTRLRCKTIELNSDKRAKERHDFDERLKKKAEEEELKRQEEEKQRLAREKLERAKLRKQAEIKARPMPVYKPLLIAKSTKPPTIPKSPVLAGKLKSKHVS